MATHGGSRPGGGQDECAFIKLAHARGEHAHAIELIKRRRALVAGQKRGDADRARAIVALYELSESWRALGDEGQAVAALKTARRDASASIRRT